MPQPTRTQDTLSKAAWSGFAFAAAVPLSLYLIAKVLDLQSGSRWRSLEQFGEEAFWLTVVLVATGMAGLLAALVCKWAAGQALSARRVAFDAVGAMYIGAFFGGGAVDWNSLGWHIWLSLVGGAIVGVLVVVLLARRVKRRYPAMSSNPRGAADR